MVVFVVLEILKRSAQIQKSLVETSETAKAGIGTMTEAGWTELIDQLLALKLIQKNRLWTIFSIICDVLRDGFEKAS